MLGSVPAGKLRVLFVCQRPDFRSYKLAKALRDSGGAEVHLLASSWDSALHAPAFDTLTHLGPLLSGSLSLYNLAKRLHGRAVGAVAGPAMGMWLGRMMRRCGSFDAVHTVAPPLSLSRLVVDSSPAPVVFDQYDLMLQTSASWKVWKSDADDEIYCLENADGLVHKGPAAELDFYKEKGHRLTAPDLSFPDGCDEVMFQPVDAAKLRDSDGQWHLVYAGGIHGPGKEYHLLPVFEALTAQGIHVHVYPAKWSEDHEDLDCYRKAAAGNRLLHMERSMPYSELVKAMSAYDFGLYYFDLDRPEFPGLATKAKTAAGNKVPSYYEAGIPVIIARGMEYSARFVAEDGAGLLVGPEEIPVLKRLLDGCDRTGMVRAVESARSRWSGKGRAERLLDFYRRLPRQ